MMSVIIGIAGGSGSGKTSLAKGLLGILPNAVLIPQDDYYRTDNQRSEDFNYDQPSAFETELLIQHLDRLASGEAILAPVYDYSTHSRSEVPRLISPAEVIIVEGILVLENEELRKRMALKIFVDTPEEDRLERRLERDTKNRGRSKESVIDQFYKTVKPMHELYVEPEKRLCDTLVTGGGKDPEVLRSIAESIEKISNSKRHTLAR